MNSLNPQLVVLAIGLALSQGSRFFNVDAYVVPIRIAYTSVQLIILGMYFYIAAKVRSKDDTTLLKYVEPKPFGGATGQPPSVVVTTVRNYDLLEVSKALRSTFMGLAITAWMHLYLKFTQPLLVSSLTVWISLYRSNIVRLHLRGQEGSDDLKRPFKQGAMFGSSMDASTDKASIEAAEKANLLYRKEEF